MPGISACQVASDHNGASATGPRGGLNGITHAHEVLPSGRPVRAWGDQKELNRFLQAYAVEKTKLEARKKGYIVSEQPLENGSIRLPILAVA